MGKNRGLHGHLAFIVALTQEDGNHADPNKGTLWPRLLNALLS